MTLNFLFSNFIKLFFLFTPFFALSMFLAMTTEYTSKEKVLLILRVMISVFIICLILMFAGKGIFKLFGITVDAFRIGAGALLFLSAVDLVQGKKVSPAPTDHEDIAVVPLSIPVIVGPATIGTLIVMSAELSNTTEIIGGIIALSGAILTLCLILLTSAWLKRLLGPKGLSVMSRLTGLILSALSAQMILTGIQGFFPGLT